MLFNLKGDWDNELLKLLGVPRTVLPEVKSSSEVYGETRLLGGPIPIAGIAGEFDVRRALSPANTASRSDCAPP